MRVAYNPHNGRVYRVLGGDEAYKLKVPVAFVQIPPGNDELLVDIAGSPKDFRYDGTEFNDGSPRPVNRKSESAKVEVDAADISATIQALKDANGWAHAKEPLVDLALVVGWLAEAVGFEPVTPAAEITP